MNGKKLFQAFIDIHHKKFSESFDRNANLWIPHFATFQVPATV